MITKEYTGYTSRMGGPIAYAVFVLKIFYCDKC